MKSQFKCNCTWIGDVFRRSGVKDLSLQRTLVSRAPACASTADDNWRRACTVLGCAIENLTGNREGAAALYPIAKI